MTTTCLPTLAKAPVRGTIIAGVRSGWMASIVMRSVIVVFSVRDMEDEFETFAVKPNTDYWLWVASEDGAASPMAYKATLCGETFTP